MTSVKIFAAGAALFLLASCSQPETTPQGKVSFETISLQLSEMGYVKYPESQTRWYHGSSPSRQEAPLIFIAEGAEGWRVSSVDFDVFNCLPTTYLSPQEAVKRSKELFSTVPSEDRVVAPGIPLVQRLRKTGSPATWDEVPEAR